MLTEIDEGLDFGNYETLNREAYGTCQTSDVPGDLKSNPGVEWLPFRHVNGAPEYTTRQNGFTFKEAERLVLEGRHDGVMANLPDGTQRLFRAAARKTAMDESTGLDLVATKTSVSSLTTDWRAHQVVVFDGSYDTHIKDGDDYGRLTLSGVFNIEPGNREKDRALAMIPSSYHLYDARTHIVQKQRGSYVALAGDIDTGNVPKERVIELLAELCGPDVAFLVYSTSSAMTDARKWRFIVPLGSISPYLEWHDLQQACFGYMEGNGLEMDWSLDRAAQPVYLPNVPASKRNSLGEAVFYERHVRDGRGLTPADGQVETALATLKANRTADEAEREKARLMASNVSCNRPSIGKGPSVIDAFNQANAAEDLLKGYGYRQGRGDCWRSPYQTSKSYATKNFSDYWVSLSGSDAAAGLGVQCDAGRFGDAFDLYCHFEHGNDFKAAIKAAAKDLGMSKPELQPVDLSGILNQSRGVATQSKDLADCPTAQDSTAIAQGAPAPLIQWTPPRPTEFEFTSAAELLREPKPIVYLIDELIEHPSLCMLFAPPSSGKSFLAISWSACIATGIPWLGRETKAGPVFYIAGEGQAGISRRLMAWSIHACVDLTAAPLYVSSAPASLMDEKNAEAVQAAVQKLSDRHGVSPALVVVDTFARNLGNGQENSNDDIGVFVNRIDQIRHRLGCSVLIVHHTGHMEKDRSRGGSALPAAMDTSFMIEVKTTGLALINKKAKEAEVSPPILMKLQKIPIGWTDQKGRQMDSAVIIEGSSTGADAANPKRLSRHQQEGLEALRRAIVGDTTAVTAGEWKGVHLETWRVEFYRTSTSDNADTKKKAFARVREDLSSRGCVKVDFETYYLPTSDLGLIAQNMLAKMTRSGHGT